MKVKNNQKNPYMLCGKLIPPGMVAEVDEDEYLKMLEIKAFEKLVTAGLLEAVEKPVKSVTPPAPMVDAKGEKA